MQHGHHRRTSIALGTYFVGAVLSSVLLLFALYLQYVEYLVPCPLCLVQRGVFVLLLLICVSATLHFWLASVSIKWQRSYAGAMVLFALFGAFIAGRQVYLQHLPKDQVPSCGAGLQHWIDTLPMSQVIEKLLLGTGDCAQVQWTLLSLSIPEWTMLVFVAFVLAGLQQLAANLRD